MVLREEIELLTRTPVRLWLLLCGAYVAAVVVLKPVLLVLLQHAAVAAGVPAVSPDSFPALLSSPPSWALGGTALLLAAGAAAAWTALVVAAAASVEEGRATIGLVTARSWRALASRVRDGTALIAVPLALLTPLAGFAVFTPLTEDLSVPPFIAREFLKAPLSGALWGLAMAAIAAASFGTVVLLSRERRAGRSVSSHRSIRSFRWSSARHLVGPAYRVAVVVALSALLPPGDTLISALLSIVGAYTVALSLVVNRRGTPRPRTARSASARPAAVVVVASIAALAISGAVVTSSATAGESDDPLVIAHRGYDRGGPENTISGLEAAARRGADVVEVDVQQTADGGFVAAHDTNLLILAGLDRNLYDMSTEEATATTVTMHGRSDSIPTMTEYVERAIELGMPLLVEFKVTGHEADGFVEDALRELDALGALDGRNLFHSLDAETVRAVERIHPGLRTGLTLAMYSGRLPAIGADFFVVEQASITPDMVADAHSRRAPLYAWTVNDDLDMLTLLDMGVDGIVTDRIDSPVLAGGGEERSRG
ncbi:hypothetical protein ELQ90_12060 [Labedella phragmitis]|uniref:GP-PDE domain-containing protein n=1 Tax=Labedella phragmitis TaxID=2498849 RepID=A0A444PS55_9MICO|nr:glycerophosphodiester phosphodiesterase family protein [Labedella phragmitis]RWZ50070.1 hypothetical protein ELQ90_12060 [Labedella phragmitis]